MKLDFQDIMSAVPAYCDPSTWPETWNPWLILLELPPFDPACNFLPDTQAALLHCSLAASAPTASPLRSLGSGCMECRTCAVLNEGRSCLCAPAWPKMMYVFGGGSLVAKVCPTLATPWTARLLCPWDSPGKNMGLGCHFFFQINICFYLFFIHPVS